MGGLDIWDDAGAAEAAMQRELAVPRDCHLRAGIALRVDVALDDIAQPVERFLPQSQCRGRRRLQNERCVWALNGVSEAVVIRGGSTLRHVSISSHNGCCRNGANHRRQTSALSPPECPMAEFSGETFAFGRRCAVASAPFRHLASYSAPPIGPHRTRRTLWWAEYYK